MKDIFTALGCMALGGYVVYEASGYPKQRGIEMHPGHYPSILGYIMLFLGVALIIRYFLNGTAPAKDDDTDRKGIGFLVLGIIGYAGLMEVIGYGVTTFLFVTLAVRLFHGSTKLSLVTGLATAIALTVVFRYLFKSPVPSGFLL